MLARVDTGTARVLIWASTKRSHRVQSQHGHFPALTGLQCCQCRIESDCSLRKVHRELIRMSASALAQGLAPLSALLTRTEYHIPSNAVRQDAKISHFVLHLQCLDPLAAAGTSANQAVEGERICRDPRRKAVYNTERKFPETSLRQCRYYSCVVHLRFRPTCTSGHPGDKNLEPPKATDTTRKGNSIGSLWPGLWANSLPLWHTLQHTWRAGLACMRPYTLRVGVPGGEEGSSLQSIDPTPMGEKQ